MQCWPTMIGYYTGGGYRNPMICSRSLMAIIQFGLILLDCECENFHEIFNLPANFLVSWWFFSWVFSCIPNAVSFLRFCLVCIIQQWNWGRLQESLWWPLILGVICFGCLVIVRNALLWVIHFVPVYVLLLLIFSIHTFSSFFALELLLYSFIFLD